MAYIVPGNLIYQDFNKSVSATTPELPAHYTGGHAKLVRYAESDEKQEGYLGYYDPLTDTDYAWPNRPAGGVIDAAYTKLYMDNALLRYFTDTIGGGDTIESVPSRASRITSPTLSFKSNGVSYPRSADFYDRDVTPGDIVKVRAVVADVDYELWTYVKDFVAETVADVIGSAVADASNVSTQSAPVAATTQEDGAENCVTVTATSSAAYDGLADGDINETYTIRVIEGSIDGDATTAKLRVTSLSGRDNDSDVTPSAFGVPTTIGDRGVTVTWDNTGSEECSLSADVDGVSPSDFVVGQEWEVVVGQAWTAPVATSGGNYTGTQDVTYIIEVTKGGLWVDVPQITVTTDRGVDISGPTNVTAAGSAVVVGTKGITVAFSQAGLRKGDRYSIEATAESNGAYRTLVLGHNLPSAIASSGTAVELDLSLYIMKDIQIGEQRTGFAPLVNWEQSATQLTVNDSLVAYDETWTDGGTAMALDVISESSKGYGQLFVEYRAWLADLVDAVYNVADPEDLDTAVSGATHPDNELKWALYMGLQNNNGVPVYFTAVSDPSDVDSWAQALDVIGGEDRLYGLVPLTRNATVWGLFAAHVATMSTPEYARWRVLWINLDDVAEKAVVSTATSEDGEEVLAKLSDDPYTTSTQYTWLEVPAGNGNFVANNVTAGDVVRYLYTTDGWDNVSYTEFIVDAVINEDTIRLYSGNTVAVNTPQKIEIWRSLNNTQRAIEIPLQHGFSTRRVRAVWPDSVGGSGYTFAGYHLCAALSAQSGGILPHQPMTRVSLAGFDDMSRTTAFSYTQLNSMAGNGVWLVTANPRSGAVYTRHAVTTGSTDDDNEREESITRNLDSISYFLDEVYNPYVGISNVSDSLITKIRSELKAAFKVLTGRNYVRHLGAQLIEGTIDDIRRHSTLANRIVIDTTLSLPHALNNIESHLVVG